MFERNTLLAACIMSDSLPHYKPPQLYALEAKINHLKMILRFTCIWLDKARLIWYYEDKHKNGPVKPRRTFDRETTRKIASFLYLYGCRNWVVEGDAEGAFSTPVTFTRFSVLIFLFDKVRWGTFLLEEIIPVHIFFTGNSISFKPSEVL